MKKNLKETIKNVLEAYKTSYDPLPQLIRDSLREIYTVGGGRYWGRLQDVEKDCETGEGVIHVFPHLEGIDEWSMLNRFDTNGGVHREMESIYGKKRVEDESGFLSWIKQNKKDLFGINGKYTQRLLEKVRNTVLEGNANESFAEDALREKFGDVNIKRYCSGDIRDTRKGIDMSFNIEGRNINVQVKPMRGVESLVDIEGDTFYEVKSSVDTNKYPEKNVDVFLFVNIEKNEYVGFQNKKNKIGQYDKLIRFYEPALLKSSNIEALQTTTKEDRLWIKKNDTGDLVRKIQIKLGVKPSGIVDEKTIDAIKKFRVDNGIKPVSGIVDNSVWRELFGVEYSKDYSDIQDIFGITKDVRIKNLDFRRKQIENKLEQLISREKYLDFLYKRKKEIDDKITKFQK